jgi:hypothetical protein
VTTRELVALAFIVGGVALLLAAGALWMALQARTYADRAAGSVIAARIHENRTRALARRVKDVVDGWTTTRELREEIESDARRPTGT